MSIFSILIYIPLGFILSFCYDLFGSFGLAVILVSFIVKMALIPFSVKQQKTSANRLRLSPKEAAIRKKYANDKEKMNKEVMELYREEGFNPAGGCLPLLIQMPLILGLYQVINRPLTYILRFSDEIILQVAERLTELELLVLRSSNTKDILRDQIRIATAMNQHISELADILPESVKILNFQFLGLDLSGTPSLTSWTPLLLIPVLSGLTAFLSTMLMNKLNKAIMPESTAGSMKGMTIFSVGMSFYFPTMMPAAVGLYWIAGNIFSLMQSLFLNKFYNPVKLAERIEEERAKADPEKYKKQKSAWVKMLEDAQNAQAAASASAQGPKKYSLKRGPMGKNASAGETRKYKYYKKGLPEHLQKHKKVPKNNNNKNNKNGKNKKK